MELEISGVVLCDLDLSEKVEVTKEVQYLLIFIVIKPEMPLRKDEKS